MPVPRSPHYLITSNNPSDDDWKSVINYYGHRVTNKTKCTALMAQRETAPSTGTSHGHTYVQFSGPLTARQVRDSFPIASSHVDACRGSSVSNVAYVSKEETRDAAWPQISAGEIRQIDGRADAEAPGQGTRIDLDELKQLIDDGARWDDLLESHFSACARFPVFLKEYIHLTDEKKQMTSLQATYLAACLRPWQTLLLECIRPDPDPRKIYWFYETAGNVGKTWMASYLRVTRGAVVLQIAKKADLAHIISKNISTIYIFDLARTSEDGSVNVAYEMMEHLKNGYILSGKYDSKSFSLAPPHVLVFANYPPDRSKLSADRWDVTNINPV